MAASFPATKKHVTHKRKKHTESDEQFKKQKQCTIIETNNRACDFFTNSAIGSKGIQESLKRYTQSSSLKVNIFSEVNNFLKSTVHNQPFIKQLQFLNQSYIEQSDHWSWLSLSNNTLLYGVGAKKCFINSYVCEFLNGEDVLSIDGTDITVGGCDGLVGCLLMSIVTSVIKVHYKATTLSSLSLINQARLIVGECVLFINFTLTDELQIASMCTTDEVFKTDVRWR